MIPPQATACGECGGRLELDEAHAILWCTTCGLTNDMFLDTTEPFKTDDDGTVIHGSHGGPPTAAGNAPAPTYMGRGSRDAKGSRLSSDPASRARLWRIRRIANQGATLPERQRSAMTRTINDIGSRLGISARVRDRAVQLGRKNGFDSRGKSLNVVSSALLLIATKEVGAGLRAADFSAVVNVWKHGKPTKRPGRGSVENQIAREARKLGRTLGVNARTTPEQFVPRIANQLGLDHEATAKALALMRRAPAPPGHSPVVAAAGSVYAAALILGTKRSQKAVGMAAGVSEVSVRNAVVRMCRASDEVRREIIEANGRGVGAKE